MYPISDALRRRFENGEKKSIEITSDSATALGLLITEADIISNSFSIDRYCVTGNKIEVGSAVAAELSLTVNNADGKFNDIIFEGAELFVRIGIAGIANSYIPCGKFTVDEPPRDNMRISLKALDFMMLFDKKANLSLIPFPCDAETLIRRISEICGVTVSSEMNFSSFPNCNETLYAPTTEVTYRQLLQWACEILGVCAYMDHIGELMLSWYVDTGINITPAVRYSGNTLEKDIEISGVIIKTQSGNFVSGTEDYPIIIENNALVYDGTEQYKAGNISNALGAFKYRPYECSCMPMPYLYPLDKITYTDKNGNAVSTVITNHTFGLNSVSNLSAKGETAQRKNYSQEKAPTKAEIDAIVAEAMKKISSTAEKLYVMYSAYSDGTNMTPDVKPDSLYIGTCVTTDNEAPREASSYTWVKIRGKDGDPGRGVVSVKTQYYRSTSNATQTGGSWSYDMPDWLENTYLWKREVTTFENPAGTKYGAAILDTSWDALGDFKKDISVVETASKELNETLANALGLHVTETTVSGSKIRYYHSKTPLSSCVAGDTILVFNANGFGVCKSGWNSGNPQFTYGTTFDGKAVWDILTANTINADLIKAGKIKSVDGAKMKAILDLDVGALSFEGSNVILGISGGNDNDGVENAAPTAGMVLQNRTTEDLTTLTLDGLEFFTADDFKSYALWIIKTVVSGITNNTSIDFSTRPNNHRSRIQLNKIQSKNLYCEDLYLFDGDSGNSATLINLRGMLESISAMQTRIGELEATLGQQHEHTNASAVRENIVEATCTSGGSYDSVVCCATCGEEVSRTKITISALGHSWKDATCTSPKTCTRCGATQGSALGHTDSNGDGYCDRCGTYLGTTPTTFTISTEVSPVGSGSVSGGGTYEKGTTQTVTATPASGYAFKRWIVTLTDSGQSTTITDNPVSFTVTYNASFEAVFEAVSSGGGSGETVEITTNIYAKVYKNGVEITNTNRSYSFNVGDICKLEPVSREGYIFNYWAKVEPGTDTATLYSRDTIIEFTVSTDKAGKYMPSYVSA